MARLAVVFAALAVLAVTQGVRINLLRGPAAANDGSKVDSATKAVEMRMEKELFCGEKKCLDDSKFWCDKKCVEKESDCSADARQKRITELKEKSKCEESKKFWCKGRCNKNQNDCPDFSTVDCTNLKTDAATGATGGATGATGGEAPKEGPKEEPTTTTTAAPNATETTTMEVKSDPEESPKNLHDITSCEMVKPWETNQWYIKHVLPGPPKGSSFCCLALIKELMNRVGALEEKLKNCASPEECAAIRAELDKIKALLKASQGASGMTGKEDLEMEKGNPKDLNSFDKHMTKPWTEKDLYKKWVGPHSTNGNFSEAVKMPKKDEQKAFPPLGSAVGPDQYATPDNVVPDLMKAHREKHGKK
jgi:hypothetical protein